MSAREERSSATVGLANVRRLRANQIGALHAGHDENRNARVWVKELIPTLAPPYPRRARDAFERELRALIRCGLPQIVKPLETQLTAEAGWAAFPAPETGNLTPVGMLQEELTLEEAAAFLRQLCDVLQALHEEELQFAVLPAHYIYRRPNGDLAWHAAGFHYLEEQLGIPPAISMQEPLLVAPEIREGRVDERSLVYSTAVWGYLLLAGPDHRASVEGLATGARPRPLYMIHDGIPAEYAQVIDRAMRATPNDRYQTFAEFATSLRRAEQPATVIPPRESWFQLQWQQSIFSFMSPRLALALALIGVAFACFQAYRSFGPAGGDANPLEAPIHVAPGRGGGSISMPGEGNTPYR